MRLSLTSQGSTKNKTNTLRITSSNSFRQKTTSTVYLSKYITQQTTQWLRHTRRSNTILPILQHKACVKLWQKCNNFREHKPSSLKHKQVTKCTQIFENQTKDKSTFLYFETEWDLANYILTSLDTIITRSLSWNHCILAIFYWNVVLDPIAKFPSQFCVEIMYGVLNTTKIDGSRTKWEEKLKG